jgi:hypothetical protein
MAFVKHNSSQVHSSSYEPVDQTLNIRFHCVCKDKDSECPKCGGRGYGSEYKYTGVGAETYATVRDAASVGKAFGEHIKAHPDKYPFKRLR